MPIRQSRLHQPHRARSKAPLPTLWLMTDERIADGALVAAARRLSYGCGIVFRHHATPIAQRRALLAQLRKVTRRRGLTLVVAGEGVHAPVDGAHVGAQGLVKPGQKHGLLTASVHNIRELARAQRIGADLIFLSPVFATRSHPGAPSLGTMRFAALARLSRAPVIALGGMTPKRFHRLMPLGAYGWAAIDALTGHVT